MPYHNFTNTYNRALAPTAALGSHGVRSLQQLGIKLILKQRFVSAYTGNKPRILIVSVLVVLTLKHLFFQDHNCLTLSLLTRKDQLSQLNVQQNKTKLTCSILLVLCTKLLLCLNCYTDSYISLAVGVTPCKSRSLPTNIKQVLKNPNMAAAVI